MAHFKQACVFLCAFCCSLFTSCGAAAPGSFSQNPEAPASSGPAAAGSATSQMEIAQQVKQLSETLEALVTLRDETYGGTFSYNMHVGLEYEGAYYEVSGADIPFQSLAEVQAIYPTMRLPETVSGQAQRRKVKDFFIKSKKKSHFADFLTEQTLDFVLHCLFCGLAEMHTDDIGCLADLLSDSRASGGVGCGIVHSKSSCK